MFEKVNPSHPDKIADRIAGAMLDLAYSKQEIQELLLKYLLGMESVISLQRVLMSSLLLM